MPYFEIVQLIFALGGALLIAVHVGRKLHWAAGLLLGYVLCNGLVTVFMPTNYFPELGPYSYRDLPNEASKSLLFTVFVIWFAPKVKPWMIILLGTGDALCMIFRWSMGWQPVGIMLNPAQDSGLIAMLLPLVIGGLEEVENKLIYGILTVAAILVTGATTGPLALAAAGIGYAIAQRQWLVGVAGVLAPAISVALIGVNEFKSDSGRYALWEKFLYWWQSISQAPKLWGTGLGTFFVYGPAIQSWDFVKRAPVSPPPTQVAVWAHNDILEMVFQLGGVGLGLSAILFLSALLCGYKKPFVFASLFALVPSLLLQMPLENVVSALVVGFIFKEALNYERV